MHQASTTTLKQSLLKIESERSDTLGMAVKGRLEGMADLVTEKAVYHHKCYSLLYTIPLAGRHNVIDSVDAVFE